MIRATYVVALAVAAVGACRGDALPCAAPVAAAPPDAETCVADCGTDEDGPRCTGTCGSQLAFDWYVELPGQANCSREPVIAADVPGFVVIAGGRERAPDTLFSITAVGSDGCVLWDDVEDERAEEGVVDSLVLGLGGAADVGYYAVGRWKRLTDTAWLDQVWIRRYTPDGDIAWTRRERSDGPRVASAVTVDASGNALVTGGGYVYGPTRGWLRRYSADGEQSTDLLELGDGPYTYVNDIVWSDAGVWLSFWVSDGTYVHPWVAGLTAEYALAWLAPSPGDRPGGGRLTLLDGDSPVMIESPGGYGPSRVSRWASDGTLGWSRTLWGSTSILRATSTPEGLVVAAGQLESKPDPTPVAVVLDADGALQAIQRIPGAAGTASDSAQAPDGALYFTGQIKRYDPADPNAIDTPPHCAVWVARAHIQ
jgi:hypothetical protein